MRLTSEANSCSACHVLLYWNLDGIGTALTFRTQRVAALVRDGRDAQLLGEGVDGVHAPVGALIHDPLRAGVDRQAARPPPRAHAPAGLVRSLHHSHLTKQPAGYRKAESEAPR